ncbi:tRNA (adenosine(37)-N6)-dimethylallyltransferase MiaA [Campylobacter concisus]|uniref:tRNA (adenosine(37)-N6)-dimethylallyltransferase MiaA n=1 Tax=Campylobacter concisus TaxID=199 RepID=UPI0018AB6857|nr:tRNA (adenosine(37)-N6)-dimethylallyltransferase MiaA [Campylobacter concisus]QPH98796.1 tRNA (adenosine(37)-N6)-dimethylallyltransferase MiaA [Campylobacter concisus]QPI00590.1 tRNA (adenosine(37)-N6)-dimethylallyltransferase MiaA [Campylobacter concisus]
MFKEFAIIGTTASGKSDLAFELAKKLNGIILSLDSLALYKEIDIASAKPNKEQLEAIKHFGVDEIYPDEEFSVGAFFEIYKNAKEFARLQDCPLIITGGSGFYLKSMLSGLAPDVPKCEPNLSNEEIYELAVKIDPEFASKFSQNDSYRLEKWYQIYKFSSQIPSIWLRENTKESIIKELAIFEILWDKDELRTRIAKRTKNMLDEGLIDEAKFLFDKYKSEPKPLKSIGLKECKQFLEGEISKSELETLIATHTAQLAKRQRTFNRSQFEKKFVGDLNQIRSEILKFLRE